METLNQEHIKKLLNGGMSKLAKKDYKILYELYFNNTSVH